MEGVHATGAPAGTHGIRYHNEGVVSGRHPLLLTCVTMHLYTFPPCSMSAPWPKITFSVQCAMAPLGTHAIPVPVGTGVGVDVGMAVGLGVEVGVGAGVGVGVGVGATPP